MVLHFRSSLTKNSLLKIFSYLEVIHLWNAINKLSVKKLGAKHKNNLVYSYQVLMGFWLDFYALRSLQRDDCVCHTHQALDFKAWFGIVFIQSCLKYALSLNYTQAKPELKMRTWKSIRGFAFLIKSNKFSSREN